MPRYIKNLHPFEPSVHNEYERWAGKCIHALAYRPYLHRVSEYEFSTVTSESGAARRVQVFYIPGHDPFIIK